MLEHPVAKAFQLWSKDILIPDEAFYSTLYHITGIRELRVPGKINQDNEDYFNELEKRFEAFFSAQVKHITDHYCCYGRVVSGLPQSKFKKKLS